MMAARYVDYRLGEGARRPFKHHSGDAGWDLYASRPVTVGPGETVDVHTDIYISMPPRLYARITGRSSSLRKHRLTSTASSPMLWTHTNSSPR